jgi:hypothetical protein
MAQTSTLVTTIRIVLVLWFRRLRQAAGHPRRKAAGGFAILFLPSRPFDIFADNLLWHECQQLAERTFGRTAQG